MNKKITLFLVFILGFLSIQSAPSVQALTSAEIQVLIQQLQAQIASLQQLTQVGETATVWCHNFNNNLKIGDTGSEVTALQTALQKEGLSSSITNQFDEKTFSVVFDFQMKYKSEVLTPSGLKNGFIFH